MSWLENSGFDGLFNGLTGLIGSGLFILFMNGANTILQGILHLVFAQYFTGAGPFPKFRTFSCRESSEKTGAFPGSFPKKALRLLYFAAYILLLCVTGLGLELTFPASADRAFGIPALAAMLPLGAAVLNVAGLFLICRLVFKCSPSAALLTAILTYYIPQFSFGFIDSAASLVLPLFSQNQAPLPFLALTLAAALMVCAGCYLLVLKFSREERFCGPYTFLLVPPCVFLLAVEFYLTHVSYSQVTLPILPETGKHLALLGLELLSLAALFSILYGYRRTCRGLEAQAAMDSLCQQIRAQKTYTAEAQMRYEKTRAFRHDVQNHLSVVRGLLKSGKVSQAQLYVEKLHAASLDLSFSWKTGSPVVDILLEEKLSLAQSKGIEAKVELALPGEGFIDELDLCVIFANALDNGIWACMEYMKAKNPGPSAFIRITGQAQGDFYMLEFENTCLPGPPPKAGTGLSNIRAVAGKYGGAMTVEVSENRFLLSVLVNISLHSGSSSDSSGAKG